MENKAFIHVYNRFKKQHITLLKFHKHFVPYHTKLISTCMENEKVMESELEVLKDMLGENEDISKILEMNIQFWQQYVKALKLDIITPLEAYVTQLESYNVKIANRSRKFVVPDSSKRQVDNFQKPSVSDGNQSKKQKIKDKHKQYENSENYLTLELKEVWKFHSKKVARILQNFYCREARFHTKIGALFRDLCNLVTDLHVSKSSKKIEDPSSSYGLVDVSSNSKGKEYEDDKCPPLFPGLVCKCRATVNYLSEKDNQLSYDEGDIISVVKPRTEDEKPQQGWLLGILIKDGMKGFFLKENVKKL